MSIDSGPIKVDVKAVKVAPRSRGSSQSNSLLPPTNRPKTSNDCQPPNDLTMLYNALIRTHHITSRKKVAALKRAADLHQCYVLLRSGGCPGIMYVEGRDKVKVEEWVGIVRKLRYKDFQLVTRPGALELEDGQSEVDDQERKELDIGLAEVESVKEFGNCMEKRGVWKWWRKGMGYT